MRTSPKITKEGVRAYLDRPWGEVARAKERFWSETHEYDGSATVDASIGMWCVMHELGYTDDVDLRDEDLAAHVKLKEILDRAGLGSAR